MSMDFRVILSSGWKNTSTAKGKTLIGWDEILEGGLAPNALVMSWRGEQGGIDRGKTKTPCDHDAGQLCLFRSFPNKK